MKVDIQTITTISCNDCKAIPVPANLIQEHGGRQWLKLRPTCQQLNQIIYGKVGKNASFSNHTAKTHTCEAKEEHESQTPQDVLSASAQDMALIQNPHMKPGEVHLHLCNVSFWLPICITPLGKSLNS